MRFVIRGVGSLALSLIMVLALGQSTSAQVMYRSGQSIQPVYEGWEENPDGTYTMWFGYFNRNYEEEPHVPVGDANFFSPGPADRGQPTHFYTRRQLFMFSVQVPADWGAQELVWTLRHDGEDYTAVGKLQDPNWMVDEGVWRSNRSNNFRGREGDFTNQAPTVAIRGSQRITASVGQAVRLTATANDDGEPGPVPQRPTREREGPEPLPIVNFVPIRTGGPTTQAIVQAETAEETGLAVTWLHHRGPGTVTFSPQAQSVALGGEATTSVTFDEPGTYVIRAVADDTSFMRFADVTVDVR